jgi:predicted XRE-type DNA-binding protein
MFRNIGYEKRYTINGAQMKVQEITQKYIDQAHLTQDKFADAMNASLRNTGVSRVSVSNWLNGKYEPMTDFLLLVMMVYSDWRMEWAIDCLCAKLPEVFARNQHGALTTLKSALIQA